MSTVLLVNLRCKNWNITMPFKMLVMPLFSNWWYQFLWLLDTTLCSQSAMGLGEEYVRVQLTGSMMLDVQWCQIRQTEWEPCLWEFCALREFDLQQQFLSLWKETLIYIFVCISLAIALANLFECVPWLGSSDSRVSHRQSQDVRLNSPGTNSQASNSWKIFTRWNICFAW